MFCFYVRPKDFRAKQKFYLSSESFTGFLPDVKRVVIGFLIPFKIADANIHALCGRSYAAVEKKHHEHPVLLLCDITHFLHVIYGKVAEFRFFIPGIKVNCYVFDIPALSSFHTLIPVPERFQHLDVCSYGTQGFGFVHASMYFALTHTLGEHEKLSIFILQ